MCSLYVPLMCSDELGCAPQLPYGVRKRVLSSGFLVFGSSCG